LGSVEGLLVGTEITLDVGGLTLTYSKNSRGIDHGSLYQEKDRKRLRTKQIDYDYFAEHAEDPGPIEMAFSRPLKEVVPRLELLGFTLERVRSEYERSAQASRDESRSIADDDTEHMLDLMSFEEFREFSTQHPLRALDDTFISGANAESEATIRGRFPNNTVLERLPHFSPYGSHAYSELSYFSSLTDIMHPYSVMRVLAENTANLDADVTWHYGPLVENGWASGSEFTPDARRTETFLVATEGSSDAHILKYAFALLRPEVADFFRFIDVSERHPFPGTGNLLKFAEGLAKIDVHNQVVFLFDNDAEDFDAYRRLSTLSLPPNMRGIMLPELEQFRDFPARGPEGLSKADINRRAAAIECYLDLKVGDYPPAKVTWTNYKKDLDTYQGVLEYKETYTKEFLRQTSETLSVGLYDAGKIRTVLDALISECSTIAAGDWSCRGSTSL
jgi:hypothetical protein